LIPTKFIAKHLKIKRVPHINKTVCKICGREIVRGLHYKKTLSSTFNDWQYCKYDSSYICKYCQACMDGKSFNGKAIRSYNLLITEDNIRVLNKSDVYNIILNIELPSILMVTYSHKKHCFFNAIINKYNKNVWVATDKYRLLIDVNKFKFVYDSLDYLYQKGFSKSELESGYYKKYKLIDDIPNFYSIVDNICQYKYTKLFEFVLHLLSKKEKKQ